MQNVVRKEIKKLYNGYLVSIRDYEAKKAIDNGGIVLIYNKEIMYLKPKDILSAEWENKMQMSKFGKPYKLVNIRWKPNLDSRQKTLF